MERPRAVYVGCSLPSIRVYTVHDRKGKHQATCSCGWEGPRRRRPDSALDDLDVHQAKTDQPTDLAAVLA